MKKRIITAKLLGLIVILTAAVSHPVYADDSGFTLILKICGFVLLGVSAFGRTWTSAYISGRKDKDLVTNGPYSVVRNPLYFFSFIGFIGAGLVFGSLIISVALIALFFFTHWSTILQEEVKLGKLFGNSYVDYSKVVPRFFPKLKLMHNPESVSLSPGIFSRALIESSLILSIFPIAYALDWAHTHSSLPIVISLF